MKYYNYKQLLDYIKNNETTEIIFQERLKTYYVKAVKEIRIVGDTFEKRVFKGAIVAPTKIEALFIMDNIAKKEQFIAYKFIDKPSEFKLLTYKSKKRLYFMEMQICEETRYKELIGAKYNEEI